MRKRKKCPRVLTREKSFCALEREREQEVEANFVHVSPQRPREGRGEAT